MIKLYKYRWFITFSLLFYTCLTLFVEVLVFRYFPPSELISILVYFYFFCNLLLILIFVGVFSRIFNKISLSLKDNHRE